MYSMNAAGAASFQTARELRDRVVQARSLTARIHGSSRSRWRVDPPAAGQTFRLLALARYLLWLVHTMLYFVIVYGTRGITSVSGMGRFHCPACGQSAYRKKKVRRWFTLFWIPMIPLDAVGEYIECGKCMGTYELDILSYDPEAERAKLMTALRNVLRRTMYKMCLASGGVDAREVDAIREIYADVIGEELSEDDVSEQIADEMTNTTSVYDVLQSCVDLFGPKTKECILAAAYSVAVADGELQPEEEKLLNNVGAGLRMTKDRFQAVLARLRADEAAAA